MDKLIYTAFQSIAENQLPLRKLNNEIANISTVGFKRSFATVMTSQTIRGPGFDTRTIPTASKSERISLEQGPLSFTGNALDVAMNGRTVMGVSAANGDLAFSRRGDLRVSSTGVLENGVGQAVRGENGTLSATAGYTVSVSGDGTVYSLPPGASQGTPAIRIGRILLRDASTTPLERRADGLFTPADGKGTATGDITDGPVPPSLTAGTLEGSSASAFEAMTKLLDFSRRYEANMRFIKEAKAMDESGASLIKAT